MSEDLTVGRFAPLVGQTFTATPAEGGEAVELELAAADAMSFEGPERQPFSLTFREAGHDVRPQQTWTLAHADLGELQVFLVPHAADAAGVQYGAHFN